MNYGMRVLVAFDQFVNVIFGGHPGETISARWGRYMDVPGHPVAKVGGRILDTIQPHHTSGAIEHDLERAQVVETAEKAAEGKDAV